MNIENLITEVTSIVKTKIQNFCEKENTTELTEELSLKMIGQTKEILSLIGSETLQHFFEQYDSKEKTITEDGKLYRLKYKSKKDFLTSVGVIGYERNVYQQDKGGKSIIPLDKKWNMERQYVCKDVQESLLYSCAHNTPEETAEIFNKISLLCIHPTTIKKVIDKTGEWIEEHKESMIKEVYKNEELPDSPDVVVGSLDGVNVLLREKGKKKGRPQERPGDTTKEEPSSAYKNAMCGTVSFYNVEKDEETGKKSSSRIMTKYTSRMPQDRYVNFKEEFEAEIKHCISNKSVKKIMLTDCHKSIQGYIKDNPFFKGFDWMIDFFHAAEHLSKLSKHLFGKSTKEGQNWYSQKREELKYKENGVSKLIRSAEYFIKKLKSKTRIKEARKQLMYFKNHKRLMNYSLHIENGWPIGSGVVEAACKSVVKQRMCRSGQRWTRTGGQKILNLRTIIKSKRWDIFWNAYTEMKKKEAA